MSKTPGPRGCSSLRKFEVYDSASCMLRAGPEGLRRHLGDSVGRKAESHIPCPRALGPGDVARTAGLRGGGVAHVSSFLHGPHDESVLGRRL